MSVHSARLGANNGVGTGGVDLYTVPTGKRTIVKCFTIRNLGAGTIFVQFDVKNGATVLFQLVYFPTAAGAAGDTIIPLPWFVMNAGEVLHVHTGSGTASVSASGAELDT